MTQNINESVCPFCQQNNRCAVVNNQGCWCANVKVPIELLQLVPIKLREKACICNACIASFIDQPELFLKIQKDL